MEMVSYHINEPGIMTDVMNQKDQGCCVAVALADVVSMVMRISRKDPYALVSAQPLIDGKVLNIANLIRFAVFHGLESEETYPLTRVNNDWDLSLYLARSEPRYKLSNLMYFYKPTDIKAEIVKNFGKNGKRYPILGAMNFRGFFDSSVARRCIESEEPFFPPKKGKNKEEDVEHALVITGCNTMHPIKYKHYCRVKNSHDNTWGLDGCSLVRFDCFKYILVPVYPHLHRTEVYVALPLKTFNTKGNVADTLVLRDTLKNLKHTNADGVLVNVLWGAVERSIPKEYNWSGYKALFETLKEHNFRIQVAIGFHGVADGDLYVSLPSWVLSIGENNPDIYFKDEQKESNQECLSWGIDDEPVLQGRSALEAYADLMKDFQSTFSNLLEEEVISIIEIGLGPRGELRYPSCCSKRGWKYPGVGAFQCYDKYMLNSLKKKAVQDQHEHFDEAPQIGNSYNLTPDSCAFFSDKAIFDNDASKYFLNWYAQQLIKHGDQVLSKARSIFGDKIVINVKLSGSHWWYNDSGGSHAAELTAGFFNSCQHDGYTLFFKMLKDNKAGLNVTVDRSYGSHLKQVSENPDKWMEEVMAEAMDMAQYPEFLDDDPVHLSSWNAEPGVDNSSYVKVLHKALDDARKTAYKAFTYYGLDQLLKAPNVFAEFVRKMHGDDIEMLT